MEERNGAWTVIPDINISHLHTSLETQVILIGRTLDYVIKLQSITISLRHDIHVPTVSVIRVSENWAKYQQQSDLAAALNRNFGVT